VQKWCVVCYVENRKRRGGHVDLLRNSAGSQKTIRCLTSSAVIVIGVFRVFGQFCLQYSPPSSASVAQSGHAATAGTKLGRLISSRQGGSDMAESEVSI
jgi:hypothetical protein